MKVSGKMVCGLFFLLIPIIVIGDAARGAGGETAEVIGRSGRTMESFPLLSTNVSAEVSGYIARVEVTQRYSNPFDHPIEAVYIFPLPDDAAVNDLFMRIGSRVIYSEVRPREEARALYEEARDEGRHAALLEEERPNTFTQSVANIMPGDEITISIRYIQVLHYDEGEYEFTYPTTVGPRFIPGSPTGGPRGDGWSPNTDRVPDASRITPPTAVGTGATGGTIDFEISLDAGVPIRGISSPSHDIEVDPAGASRAVIRNSSGDRIPNKDLILRYRIAGEEPEFGFLAHRSELGGYLTMMIQPQTNLPGDEEIPRELVFLLDASGSMEGLPIEASKAVVLRALGDLTSRDSFQIIRFAGSASSFAPAPVPGTKENIALARDYIEGLSGSGGTEMLTGIRAALSTPPDPVRKRMVFFLTDGYIGNEAEIIREVGRLRGDARVFSLGVGSSVNRYLLDEVARAGRGFAQYIRQDEDPERAVERFYRRIRRPALTDLSVDWNGLAVYDMTPTPLPDLFAGQPLIVTARYARSGSADVTLFGNLGGRPWSRTVRLVLPEDEEANRGLALIWAKNRIDEISEREYEYGYERARSEITALAMRYHLASSYTSFVAVEREIIANIDPSVATRAAIPVELPEGVSLEGTFGEARVSLSRVKPGDPVLYVDAPRESASVIAFFPWGETKRCSYDEGAASWTTRFLVPRGVRDGRYTIRVLVNGPNGESRWIEVRITVDSEAPMIEVMTDRERYRPGETVHIAAEPIVVEAGEGARIGNDIRRVRVFAAGGGVGEMTVAESASVVPVFTASITIPESAPAGPFPIRILATDEARNADVRVIEVEVVR